MKINVYVSKIQSKVLASFGYVMRDYQDRIIIDNGMQICDCPILVTKYLMVREAIAMPTQNNLQKIII